MGRPLKRILIFVLGVVAVIAIGVIVFMLMFDPNDYRERIAAEVEHATGREFEIEGDLDLSLFPWLAVDVGRSRLGNAPGFGDAPFAEFRRARLSVRLLPMLFGGKFRIGTASLDGFELNLAVAADGRNNWQEFVKANETPTQPAEPGAAGVSLDVAGIEIRDAMLTYADAQRGESYTLRNLNVSSGGIGGGRPVGFSADFRFELQPADLAGDFEIDAELALDTDAATIALREISIAVLGVDIAAEVPAFGYDAGFTPVAEIDVAAFSLKTLMQTLGMEPLETADPDALGSIRTSFTARISPATIALDDLELVVDDTTFTGSAAIAQDEAGTITVDLAGDSIDLNGYMAPAGGSAEASGEAVPVEIPVELIRTLNLRGNFTLESATLAAITFTNVGLAVNATGGRLRMHPISAEMFDGTYAGDVRIDASGAAPVLSVDETVADVNMASLAKAMFDEENVTGSIDGNFRLSGRGADLTRVQRSLNGSMSFELADGTYEGRDIWYELRRARALLKKEPEPEPELPPRTRFSSVRLSGPVTDGVFRSDDLFAELPFMQLTGEGSVDLAEATIDYRLAARVLDRPELASGATPEELADLTKATIPMRVTGPLAEPSIKPDLESVLREKAKQKVRERLLEELLDDDADDEAGEGEEAAAEKDDRDKVKDALRDLLKRD